MPSSLGFHITLKPLSMTSNPDSSKIIMYHYLKEASICDMTMTQFSRQADVACTEISCGGTPLFSDPWA